MQVARDLLQQISQEVGGEQKAKNINAVVQEAFAIVLLVVYMTEEECI